MHCNRYTFFNATVHIFIYSYFVSAIQHNKPAACDIHHRRICCSYRYTTPNYWFPRYLYTVLTTYFDLMLMNTFRFHVS